MDKVRLGRALGYGTRHAARTLAAVAEAAAAPAAHQAGAPSTGEPVNTSAATSSRAQAPNRVKREVSVSQVRGVTRSFWGPLAAFSGALWLRVTGLFFAVVALAMANGAWRLRGIFLSRTHVPAQPTVHFWVFVGFALLFGYFAASSFVRASMRERRAVRASAS